MTSLFVGTGEQSLGAALENLQVGAFVAPSVAASSLLWTRPFTVGKSMAMRRRDVATMGGFGVVGDVLAEDHVLGRMVAEQAKSVRLSMDAVENRNVRCTMRRTFERHTRWAKLRRAISPAAFVVEPLGSPLTVASLFFLASPGLAAGAALAAALLLQWGGAVLSLKALRGRAPWRLAALEPLRSYVTFACWLAACVSRPVTWRGHAIRLGRDSTILTA